MMGCEGMDSFIFAAVVDAALDSLRLWLRRCLMRLNMLLVVGKEEFTGKL